MSTEVSQLYSQDKYAEAAPIAERYAALVREKRGHKHTEYATAIGWLTRVCPAEGRYAETEPLHKRTIAIDDKALGPEHPSVGPNLNNLAELWVRRPVLAEGAWE